jgi:hypothetical protein
MMTTTMVIAGTRQVPIETVTPDAQASVAAETVLDGSEIDARGWRSLAYTLLNADETITYRVYGANASDYSDEVVVSGPTDILAAAASSYAVAQAPYGYYRVKILDKVGGTHGTVTLAGIAKG